MYLDVDIYFCFEANYSGRAAAGGGFSFQHSLFGLIRLTSYYFQIKCYMLLVVRYLIF